MADERSKPVARQPKAWRPNRTVPANGRPGPSRRARKVFVLLAIMLALAGALTGFLLYVHPFHPPVFLSLPVTEYADRRFSPNAFAQQDGDALLKHFPGKDSGLAFNSQQADLLRQKLGELKNRRADALVLHVSALALCREGKVYLLPADGDADRPETWLPLETLLQAFRECPAERKLLLLDVMKPLADPRIGVLRNDVAARVEQSIQATPDLGFWVLCACAPGQTSLVSEELRRSIFGYYLDLGLGGRADSANAGAKPDGRITVRKLAAYVTSRVDRWAKVNRDTRQTPLLLGNGPDFEIAATEKTHDQAADESVEEYPQPLQEGWARRDAWLQIGGCGAAPGAVSNLDATLLWAEQRWRGGFAFARVEDKLTDSLTRSQTQMDKARPGAGPRPRSLFLAVGAAKQEPDDATLENLKALARDAESAVKAPDPAAAKAALEPAKAAFLKKVEGKPFTLADAVFQVVTSDPQADKVRFLVELLRSVQPTPQFAETAQLQRLTEIDPKKWPTDARSIYLLLQIARKRERANSCDAEFLPWITAKLQAAAARQHEGEALLFGTDPRDPAQAGEKLLEADRGLDGCLEALRSLQEARLLVDRAMEFLPGYARYLANLPDIPDGEERDWQDAIRACRELCELFGRRPEPIQVAAGPPDDLYALRHDALHRAATTLRDRLETLGRAFSSAEVNQLQTLGEKADASPVILLKMHARLATPLLKFEQRTTLWKAAGALARQLQARMEAVDADQDHPPAPLPAFEESDRKRFENAERKRGALRVRLSLGLLQLTGVGRPDLEQEEAQLAMKGNDADWEALGAKLRTAWSRELPDRLQDLLRRDNLPEADALNRVAPPFEDPPGARSRESLDDPAVIDRRRLERTAWRWLGRHYREEAKSYQEASAAAAFYLSAADDFLNYAR